MTKTADVNEVQFMTTAFSFSAKKGEFSADASSLGVKPGSFPGNVAKRFWLINPKTGNGRMYRLANVKARSGEVLSWNFKEVEAGGKTTVVIFND